MCCFIIERTMKIKKNKPFDKAAELARLDKIYAMSDAEIAALDEGQK